MNRDLYEYLGVLGFDVQPFGNFAVAKPQPSEAIQNLDSGSSSPLQTLSGIGNPHAQLMFVEETGDEAPFAERGQELLTKMIEAMGLKRDDTYITRAQANELHWEIEQVSPEVVVTMGAAPTQDLLSIEESFGQLRGHWRNYARNSKIAVMPTYAATFLLRNPNMKKAAWEDLQQVMAKLGLKK